MARLVRTLPARRDLQQIWLYIAERNLPAADRLIERIDRTLQLLGRNPLLGELAEQYGTGLRRITVGSYVLYYELGDECVQRLRLLHGSRKLDELL